MTDKPLTPEELNEIEEHAIRRSEELVISWENHTHGQDSLQAAHAYAALALAAGQRLARLTCSGCRDGCDSCC